MLICRFGGLKSAFSGDPKESRSVLRSRVGVFPLFSDLLFRILHEKGAHQAREPSCVPSYDGSGGLAAQEGRDIENVFLDQIARGGGAAVRIEALRSRLARIFRIRVCRPPFGVVGRREGRRTL